MSLRPQLKVNITTNVNQVSSASKVQVIPLVIEIPALRPTTVHPEQEKSISPLTLLTILLGR